MRYKINKDEIKDSSTSRNTRNALMQCFPKFIRNIFSKKENDELSCCNESLEYLCYEGSDIQIICPKKYKFTTTDVGIRHKKV